MTIDITKPLELSDGTPIVRAERKGPCIDAYFETGWRSFYANGNPIYENDDGFYPKLNGRTLRNVKEPVMWTSEECLQRMEALVRRMASASTIPNELGLKTAAEYQSIARAIVAELDKASGPQTDEEWATHMREEYMNDGEADSIVPTLLKAIAKGRELEHNSIVNVGIPVSNIARTYDDKGNLCHE